MSEVSLLDLHLNQLLVLASKYLAHLTSAVHCALDLVPMPSDIPLYGFADRSLEKYGRRWITRKLTCSLQSISNSCWDHTLKICVEILRPCHCLCANISLCSDQVCTWKFPKGIDFRSLVFFVRLPSDSLHPLEIIFKGLQSDLRVVFRCISSRSWLLSFQQTILLKQSLLSEAAVQ